MSSTGLDAARQAALEEARRAELRARRLVTAAGILEALIFVGIVLIIDLNDRTHLLIFLCACLAYGPIAFAVYALRSYLDASTRRVLTAIQYGTSE